LLVASLQQGGQREGPQDLALVPAHPERAGAGKALLPVGAGAVEVSGEQPQQLRGRQAEADRQRLGVVGDESLELLLDGCRRLQVTAMAGKRLGQPEQGL
jgi:hypothetical protein